MLNSANCRIRVGEVGARPTDAETLSEALPYGCGRQPFGDLRAPLRSQATRAAAAAPYLAQDIISMPCDLPTEQL